MTIQDSLMAPEETIEYTKELTGFEDTVGKIELEAQPIPLPDQNPYESQQMEKVLSRVYEVGTWLWKSTHTTGFKLAHVNFPDALFNKPNIKDKLKGFKYFRANVKVRIKLNSTLQHYGKLVIWYIPNCGLGDPAGAPYSCFRYPHVIVSAATQESAEIEIPFISRNPWLQTTERFTGEIATLYATVLHPLGSANSTTTQETYVTMFANFENISVAGTFPEDPDSQSSMSNVDHETLEKSERGILTNVAMTTADIASKVSKFPIVGGIASAVAPVASTLGNLFDYFGLEKPTSVESYTPNVPQVGQGFAQGRGLDLSKKFSMDLSNKSTTNLNDQPVEDTMSLKKFLLRPSLFQLGSFDRTFEAGDEVISFYVSPMIKIASGTKYITTIPYDVARCFAYWRGSMKYKFLFTCSKFTTARVRISWSPENEPLPANYDGDVVSKVVDIMGDTEVSFTVPYLDNLYMLGTNPVFSAVNGKIMITILNRPVGGDDLQSTKIHFAGFMACGEDFELFHYVGFPKYEAYEPDIESQSSMISDFGKVFDPLIPASFVKVDPPMISERFSSFKDILLIPWYVGDFTDTHIRTDLDYHTDVHPFMYLHRFHRGSMRVKIIVQEPGIVEAYLKSTYKGTNFNGPVNIWHTKDNPIVEYELPYYSNFAYRAGHSGHRTPTSLQGTMVYVDGYYPSGFCTQFLSVGDDYIGFFPQWPGYLVDVSAKTEGEQGGNLPSTQIK